MTDTHTGPLWISGHPVSKGSMRCVTPHVGGRRGVLVPEKTVRDPDNWHGRIPTLLALRLPQLVEQPVDGPVELLADFKLKAPKSSKFGNHPIGHGTGDLDKLLRALGDGVTNSGIITDDSRITRIVAEKSYAAEGGEEGCTVELRPHQTVAVDSAGRMPVRIQAGRHSYPVGAINSPADLPTLLRRVADEIERQGNDLRSDAA
jgi:Holliday junction resolvase RusA-like endonuclease